MDGISTGELVARMRRSGLTASAASLRQDVHRGLISPRMPSPETPGRGTAARWTPMSVRRARRTARLRKRGVNGHVLPLLLFLADGWGWPRVRGQVQAAARKGWELDRRHLAKPSRVATRADLVDNAQQTDQWLDRPDLAAIAQLRTWLYTASWFGDPEPGTSPVPMLRELLQTLPGPPPTPDQLEESARLGRSAAEVRAELALLSRELPQWLETLDADAVERGRLAFWKWVGVMRQLRRLAGQPGSNPLTLGGLPPTETAAFLRSSLGRVTPAQLLGAFVAQAMVFARIQSAVLDE